jgi:hypothetical protein
MNTTNLIGEWSMGGAGRDVRGRFRSTDDILAAIAGNQATPAPTPTASASSFLIKGSDEEGWRSVEAAATSE